jgi:hypothetical protein
MTDPTILLSVNLTPEQYQDWVAHCEEHGYHPETRVVELIVTETGR